MRKSDRRMEIVNSIIGWIRIILIVTLCWSPSVSYGMDNLSGIKSEAVILIDAKTGQVLYEKNSDKKMYPASITKIVTGIMAIESPMLDELATTSKRARWVEGTRVYLAKDEAKPLRELVYGLLINSGNDAAIVIAEHLSGSVENFATEMNTFVDRVIGSNHTNFTNPHGLFHEQHYTTARDMAMLSQYAMSNRTFRKIVGTRKYPWKGEEWVTNLVNHNKLLWRYDGATGIKNGYVSKSGNTLVSSAKRGTTELIVVCLKAPGSETIYSDAKKLLDYGFQHYETNRVFAKGKNLTEINGASYVATKDLYYTIPKGDPIRYLIEDNTVKLFIGDQLEVIEDLVVRKELPSKVMEPPVHVEQKASKDKSGLSYLLGFISVISFIGVIIWIWYVRRKQRTESHSYKDSGTA